ncbi:hypothetical protein [Arthrobacter sp. VKM Ac-2550]|uniref:hypothetical protein n=1 Tax=Crystallibacter permensis TaxID=1938888 RepID=UPI002226AE9E|nr:hypothetical protein [Arthrobacter sp. VKM Ac-2550]
MLIVSSQDLQDLIGDGRLSAAFGLGAVVLSAATTHLCARFLMAMFSVQPVKMSVAVSVQACSPLSLWPQWATRSISKKLDSCSISSMAWRTCSDERSVDPGAVADTACGYRASLAGLSRRSMVAGLIATSCPRT